MWAGTTCEGSPPPALQSAACEKETSWSRQPPFLGKLYPCQGPVVLKGRRKGRKGRRREKEEGEEEEGEEEEGGEEETIKQVELCATHTYLDVNESIFAGFSIHCKRLHSIQDGPITYTLKDFQVRKYNRRTKGRFYNKS